jgi:deaminated glutathione amidase
MCASREPSRNIAEASAMIREAAAQGARFVSTPEMTNVFEPDKERLKAVVKPEGEDACAAAFSTLAAELNIWLLAGSLALKSGDKLVNRSLLFSPNGAIAARYDKIHLYDADPPGIKPIRESESFTPGAKAVVADTEFGRLGLTICYDVRFAALYHTLAMAGATILTVPAAFTVPTGKAHWHILLRARAIETGSFVLAAAQGGAHDGGRETYGHSLAVSPWGEILTEGGVEPGVFLADLDLAKVADARARLPVLNHVRPFALKARSRDAT